MGDPMRYKMTFSARLACIGVIGALTCLNALGVQKGRNGQSTTHARNAAAWESRESFLKLIIPAAVDAAKTLKELKDPVFSSK
jgi:hypothetical protein